VTNSEGNTVKVNTSAATSVTKTVKTKVNGIYPGETVTVTGAAGSGGTVSAESISVGSSGGGSSGSGASSLFGSG
jgi:ABC-type microcin C transport system duplicated ATPase subunit YejF